MISSGSVALPMGVDIAVAPLREFYPLRSLCPCETLNVSGCARNALRRAEEFFLCRKIGGVDEAGESDSDQAKEIFRRQIDALAQRAGDIGQFPG